MRQALMIVVLLLTVAAVPLSADERPNIVMIMADDLGFADIGCYGSEIATPRLDQLAGRGLRFTQFYNTAKCHSSRVSLLTGLYCDQAGGQNSLVVQRSPRHWAEPATSPRWSASGT